MSDQALLDEIKKLFDDYARVWHEGDWLAVAMLYHVPSITMRGDGSIHSFQSREEVQEFLRRVGEGYNREGNLGTGRHYGLAALPIGARSVLATLTWQAVLQDGSILREWQQSYNLVRADGRWQILVATFHLE